MPQSTPSSSTSDLETHLDNQIAHIRSEIAKLRTQKQKLSSALLRSSRIQKHLSTSKQQQQKNSAQATNDARLRCLKEQIETQQISNDIEIHRFAYGITAFPFDDSTLEPTHNGSLLGLRFDLHPTKEELLGLPSPKPHEETKRENEMQGDENVPTCFLLLRKLRIHGDRGIYMQVEQHNIPKHIDVHALAQRYLPLSEGFEDRQQFGNGGSDAFQDDSGIDVTQDIVVPDVERENERLDEGIVASSQDVHAFVSEVHAQLRSWHYRISAVTYLRFKLDIKPLRLRKQNEVSRGNFKYGVTDLRCTHDGRKIQIYWTGNQVAALKIGIDGYVEQVVAYGTRELGSEADELGIEGGETESVRLHNVERLLMKTYSGDRVSVMNLEECLDIVQEYCFPPRYDIE